MCVGFLRTFCIANDTVVDYIPIDIVVKSLIVSTWDLAVRQNKSEIEIMNCVNNSKADWLIIKVNHIVEFGRDLSYFELPFNNILWPPSIHYTSNTYKLYFEILLNMFLPSLFLDALLKLSGRKPMFVFYIHIHRYI